MIWICLMFCITMSVCYWRQKDFVAAAYYQGYRDCIKEAIITLKDIESKAMKDAMPGELTAGVVRAQATHECSMAVRDLSYRIGRPL